MAKKQPPKPRWQRWVPLGVLIVLVAAGSLALFIRTRRPSPVKELISYQVMQIAQTEVKSLKPPPVMAALQYAYVANVYQDALQVAGQNGALLATSGMLQTLYSKDTTHVQTSMAALAARNGLDLTDTDGKAQVVLSTYQQRYKIDGHDLVWDGTIPVGDGKWFSKVGLAPLTPRAGEWQRWNVNAAITVPTPPVLGSAEDKQQFTIVEQAVAGRNGEDVNLINFWGGVAGTEGPSGIWQNQLYRTIHTDLSKNMVKADKTYAQTQALLAQTLSDAFMECWKVKFTYWTARPDMRNPAIVTAMADPNFPGYVSGHSTISKAAADVLSVAVPNYAAQWEDMAKAARRSRLVAGIHFDNDNVEGFNVGTAVAKQVITNKHVTKIL